MDEALGDVQNKVSDAEEERATQVVQHEGERAVIIMLSGVWYMTREGSVASFNQISLLESTPFARLA